MAKLNLSFDVKDKSKSGELQNAFAFSMIIVLISFAWFVFLVVGASCYNSTAKGAWQAGAAFLALFGISWGVILAFGILAVLSTSDYQNKKDAKYGTELLAFSICMIFLPIIFGFLTAIYAKKAMGSIETKSTSSETASK